MPTPVDGLWEDRFKAYEQVSAQITRWFRHFSVYIGGENLTGFRQKKTIINAEDPRSNSFDTTMVWAPAAIGPYSQAIKVGNLVYTSGQIPIDPATGSFVEGGIKEQTRQSLTNIKAILAEVGLSMSNVVKTMVFLADMNDFADMNAVYAEFFSEPYPARS